MNLIFHEEASEEMTESARFYESKSEGLGSDFLTAVQETTQRILNSPGAAAIERATIRRRLVPGFPFTILYEVFEDGIFIAAIMHQRRKPGYWRKRLRS
jgi:toxin ParE1/3/4